MNAVSARDRLLKLTEPSPKTLRGSRCTQFHHYLPEIAAISILLPDHIVQERRDLQRADIRSEKLRRIVDSLALQISNCFQYARFGAGTRLRNLNWSARMKDGRAAE